ncbi:MAG: hypothetical protein CW338_03825 [Clostridiales bacterium]|nr:hypothetical protein [Clostridiales bacterium]
MPVLTVITSDREIKIPFNGTPLLSELLMTQGLFVPRPCGGRGICGKCRVRVKGSVSGTERSETCLACSSRVTGDATVFLADASQDIAVETGQTRESIQTQTGELGAAVDIGTTTVAVRLYDLSNGACIAAKGMMNPQTAVSADVIGRIEHAMRNGNDQQSMIENCIGELCGIVMKEAGIFERKINRSVICGNTTMMYLLTGRDPASLSHAPFKADHLFDEETYVCGMSAYLPPCAHAYVGADLLCSILHSGMVKSDETSLLCDIGTNGEIALYRNGVLYVTSTAAGPVFEGVGISCGMPGMPGAIDRVIAANGQLYPHVIGGGKAKGICGSGILDAVYCLLLTERIDGTGAMEDETFTIDADVNITRADIRAVQLGKAAIAAGIGTLLETAGCPADEIKTVYLAGGFGNHMDPVSAAGIGLIRREWKDRIVSLGNAAVMGAGMMLLDQDQIDEMRRISAMCSHIDLGGNPVFNRLFIEYMTFE